ncbi:metallophosphoesterase [Sphingomonas sp. GC_Shp_3]|uniref:metallophosphoesterase n=1 Tax=Sphingomonas sp. GC_Shp_3 TaxID=2937383 RepID=UPI00226AF314|nr:metallophosphoesterase [Sphingomonas sp. GC_Shp_3]
MRRLLFALSLLAAVGLTVAAYAFAEARRDPVVRRATIALPLWPTGERPIRVALLSDLHLGSAASDAARLRRIVAQVDTLRPDLILIAGDFIFGDRADGAVLHGPAMIAPLRALRAPLGVIAVLGNHDYHTGAEVVRRQLQAAGIRVLRNQAARVGPLSIGGIDDSVTGHAKVVAATDLARKTPGARLLLTHSPDVARFLAPDMTLLLAGHTHCGQVMLPLIGPLVEVSAPRYRCGIVHEKTRTVIVTAGIGISGVPFRLGAPPDLWLLTLGPKAAR